MIILVAALAAFVAVHTMMSRPWLRDPLTARLGRAGYATVNGIVSLVGLALVFWAYRAAPYVEAWPARIELWAVPVLVLPLAGILFVSGVTTPGAGLSGDRLPDGADAAPGILRITRHPVPWALILWAGSHVVANGDVAAIIFFGTFLAFAAVAPRLIDRRRRRLCGDAAWNRFAAVTSVAPFAAIAVGRTSPDWSGIGWRRLAGGLLIYGLLALAHPWFAGVAIATL